MYSWFRLRLPMKTNQLIVTQTIVSFAASQKEAYQKLLVMDFFLSPQSYMDIIMINIVQE